MHFRGRGKKLSFHERLPVELYALDVLREVEDSHMYVEIDDEEVVRIPPQLLGEDYDEVVERVAREKLEGQLVDVNDEKTGRNLGKCYIVTLTDVSAEGDGTIVHGDGGVYQRVRYRAIAFYPEMQEIVEGTVVSVQKFGAFIKIGPFEGLLHIGQIMDDRIDIDLGNQRFIGKDTKKDLKVGDKVRVKIVHINLSSSSIADSRIGLTMKQMGLGKIQWLAEKKVQA